MHSLFLKNHLLDFEVVIAIGIAVLLRYRFDVSWLFAIPAGLSAFVIIPLVLLAAFQIRALWLGISRR